MPFASGPVPWPSWGWTRCRARRCPGSVASRGGGRNPHAVRRGSGRHLPSQSPLLAGRPRTRVECQQTNVRRHEMAAACAVSTCTTQRERLPRWCSRQPVLRTGARAARWSLCPSPNGVAAKYYRQLTDNLARLDANGAAAVAGRAAGLLLVAPNGFSSALARVFLGSPTFGHSPLRIHHVAVARRRRGPRSTTVVPAEALPRVGRHVPGPRRHAQGRHPAPRALQVHARSRGHQHAGRPRSKTAVRCLHVVRPVALPP